MNAGGQGGYHCRTTSLVALRVGVAVVNLLAEYIPSTDWMLLASRDSYWMRRIMRAGATPILRPTDGIVGATTTFTQRLRAMYSVRWYYYTSLSQRLRAVYCVRWYYYQPETTAASGVLCTMVLVPA